MQLCLLKVLGRSVAISIARISTALSSRPFAFTKSSLQTMAQALPSLVGLYRQTVSGGRERGKEGGKESGGEEKEKRKKGRGGRRESIVPYMYLVVYTGTAWGYQNTTELLLYTTRWLLTRWMFTLQ